MSPFEDINAEKAILGSILLDNDCFAAAREKICADDFSFDQHRRIFAAIVARLDSENSVDSISLGHELRGRNELESVGGYTVLSSLADGLPLRPNIAAWVKIVREYSQRRRLCQLGDRLALATQDPGQDIHELLGDAESKLSELREQDVKREDTLAATSVVPLLDKLERERNRTTELLGLATGIRAFDAVTRGLHRSELAILGGNSGDGKTAFAIQALCESSRGGIPTLFFSLEMTKEQVLRRIWSIVSGVAFFKIRDPLWMNAEEYAAVRHAAEKTADWPLWIDPESNLHIDDLCARAKVHIRKHGVKLIAVDYCQIVRAPGRDERTQVAAVSRGLTRLSKDSEIPVLLLSQLARNDRASGRRPRMSDLRESSQLENDAAVVVLVYRPVGEDGHQGDKAEVIIDKHRNGTTGVYNVTFDQSTLTFDRRPRLQAAEEVISGREA